MLYRSASSMPVCSGPPRHRPPSTPCSRVVAQLIGIIVASLALSTSTQAQCPNFSAATNTAVGANPLSVAVGDFNGDGMSDLAVANSSSNNVSILLGTGTGTFGAATNFAAGATPASVAIGDFNGDGRKDLAVASSGSNNVSILLGTGTGTFGAATNFAVGSTPRSVAVGDFNGDGRSDLAVTNRPILAWETTNSVSILLGTGTGTFGSATDFAAGTNPSSVAVGDFNGDGRSDLAVANKSSNNVSILLGTGTGTFGPATNLAVGATPSSVAVDDLNGDGRTDLAVANEGSNNVSILLGSPGTLTLRGATDSIGEEAGAVTVTVDRTGGTDCSVTVDYATANGSAVAAADYTATSGTLTFGPGVASQSFAVPITEDALFEGDETFTVTLSNPVGDAALGAIASATVSIVENDAAGVTVSKTTATTSETGTTDSFTYVLTAQPTTDVTLTVASGDTTEGLLSDGDETGQASVSLIFTNANWNVPQTVTLTGQDDPLTDGNQIYNLSATTASTDPGWHGLPIANIAVTNNDDDTPGVDVTPSSGLVTTEGGGIARFEVVLNSQPSADVSIDFSSSDTSEALISSDGVTQQSTVTLTFTAVTWNVPQTVTLHGQDDLVTDGDQAFSVTSSALSSADGTWSGLAVSDAAATNQDDEVSAITITPTSGLLTNESGGTDSFTIVLSSQPTADVTIDLTSSDTTEGSVAPTTVTFTSVDWNIPQTVTITGVDDAIDDGDQAWSVVTADAVSTDTTYGGAAAADVSVLNVDDDTRGINVTPVSGLITSEAGGSSSFTIVLNSEPAADVVIGLSSSDPSEGIVAPASVTFTSANWSTPQSVTVTGANDLLDDGDQAYTIVTANAISTDVSYNGFVLPDVPVTNLDDDARGITVTPSSGLATTEAGGADSFTIVLASEPFADVTIDLSSSDTSEGNVEPASVTFTSANWSSPQTITVTGIDDLLADGDQAYTIVTANAVSTDAGYNGFVLPDVPVTNLDDDAPGITVTPVSGLATTEAGGSDSFTIVLESEPVADVMIDLTSSNMSEGTVAPASVTFTSTNWDTPQTVTVTGVDDVLADGDQAYTIVTEDAVSADASYDGLPLPDVSVTNLDDETSATDRDGDGVDDVIEDAGANGGDANDDGIPDSMQPSVATLPAANGSGSITLMSTCQLRDVATRLQDGLERTPVLFPYALIEFRMPCAAANMTVLYHAGASWDPATGYWKYGPETPGETATTKWYALPGVAFDTTTIAGATVARAQFALADGMRGDDTGVDGVIVDQGGPGSEPVSSIPTASEWMLLLLASLLVTAAFWRLR